MPRLATTAQTLVEAVEVLEAATADQVAAWVRQKRDERVPKATLYRVLNQAVEQGAIDFLEADGRRIYYPPGKGMLILGPKRLRALHLPSDLQRALARFVAEEGCEGANLLVVVRP